MLNVYWCRPQRFLGQLVYHIISFLQQSMPVLDMRWVWGQVFMWVFAFINMYEAGLTAHLFTNRCDSVDEWLCIHSVSKTELMNIPLHKLRHKICVKLQWSSKPHTCWKFIAARGLSICSTLNLDISRQVQITLCQKKFATKLGLLA